MPKVYKAFIKAKKVIKIKTTPISSGVKILVYIGSNKNDMDRINIKPKPNINVEFQKLFLNIKILFIGSSQNTRRIKLFFEINKANLGT